MTNEKETALTEIVGIAEKHDITADEIAARMLQDAPKQANYKGNLMKTIFSYIGGLFIFAGLGFFVAMLWDDFTSPVRVAVTFGSGLIALIMAIATHKDPRYEKAVTPLLLIAAFLQPTGLFVLLNEYFDGDDAALAAMVVFGPMAIQMALVFTKLKRTSLVFFYTMFGFAFFSALMHKLNIDYDLTATVLGLSGLLISYHYNKTPYRSFVPFTYFVFAMMFACGTFSIIHDIPVVDFLLIGVASGMIYMSVVAQSRSLLVASVLVMIGYLGYFTAEYFADMLSWPIAVIMMGFVMIGLSRYAVKLSADIK